MTPGQKVDMTNNMKKIFFSVIVLGVLVFGTVHAQGLLSEIEAQNQVFAGESGAGLKDADPRIVVAQVIKVLLSITGTLIVVWTFYGGFLIFTSAGDSEKIDHAKSIITNGVIGLLLVLASYGIAGFVYNLWANAQKSPGEPQFNFWIDQNQQFYAPDPGR